LVYFVVVSSTMYHAAFHSFLQAVSTCILAIYIIYRR